MFNMGYWQGRANRAEAEAEKLRQALTAATEHLDSIELQMQQRAVLASINTTGRTTKFLFTRNGQTHIIETYSTMNDDVTGWRRDLLQ